MTGPRGSPGSLDVYLQPAVVGGGLGDIEEVLAVGRRLERRGWKPLLYRRAGRPLPSSVEGPWGWPATRRVHRLVPRSPHALTVTPWWGVSAVPDSERAGPPGPWSVETEDIERAYGPAHVVHLSLEEFARTLTSRQQTRERWREGGVAVRMIPQRMEGRGGAGECRAFHDAYRKWRAFDRPNVLHLFTGFRASQAFGREFPEAIQTGPLWPEPWTGAPSRPRRNHWLWYASPSTSDRLARELARGMPPPRTGFPPVRIEVRGPRPVELPSGPAVQWQWAEPSSPADWSGRFHRAELRLVTGSRTLLEAIAAGGPFLYFNGVLNRGSRTRRHRPEKIQALLEVWRRHGVPGELRRDLSDFSRLRRVSPILRKARQDRRWSRRFPPRSAAVDFPRSWSDAGVLIDQWIEAWTRFAGSSSEFVAQRRRLARSARNRL
ncbi:MAG: hypothetical protein WA688_07870 [Thermoplasmata archaeon]